MTTKQKYQEAVATLKDIEDDDGMIADALNDIHRYVGELRRERAMPQTAPKVIVDDSASIQKIEELETAKARLETNIKSLRIENKKLWAYFPTIDPGAPSDMILRHLTTAVANVLEHYEGYNHDKVIAVAHVLASINCKSKKEVVRRVNAILEVIDVKFTIKMKD